MSKLSFTNVFTEGKKVGAVYHFTNISSLEKIIQGNKKLQINPWELISHNGTLSCTRNFCMTSDLFPNDFDTKQGYIVRLALDGDCVSNKYKINPISGLTSTYHNVFGVDKNEYRVSRHSGEQEEVVQSKNYLFKIRKCIKSIDVSHYSNKQKEKLDRLNTFINKDLGLDINFSRKFKPLKESESYDDRNEHYIFEHKEMNE